MFERLTATGCKFLIPAIASKNELLDEIRRHQKYYDRLAAYEDSGLSPEEVVKIKKCLDMWVEICKKNNVSIVQFKKWAEAEQDGRLLVLPCKVGDTVYIAVKEWDARYCLKSSFVPCVREGTVAHICISHKGIIVCVTVKGEYSEYYEFGKTVFLTREAAEKALGGGQDGP
jgi:hypothetical protein